MIELSNGAMNLLRRHTARLTHVWQINRPDGQQPLQFTTHDQILNRYDSTIYDPRPGLTVSANRRSVGLSEKSIEITGLIGDGGVSYQDLHQGRLWGAVVMQHMHDWAFDFGPQMMLNEWFIADIVYDDRAWTFALTGLAGRLTGKRGEVFSRLCQNELGVMNTLANSTATTTSACHVNINVYPKRVSDVVIIGKETTHGEDPTLRTIYVKKVNGTTGLANAAHTDGDHAANYFQYGRIVFKSGELEGLQETIYEDKSLVFGASAAGVRAFTMMRPMPDLPLIGDTLDVFVGCDKNWETCKNKFDALQGNTNPTSYPSTSGGFRGFPDIPGTDKASTYPPARGQ